MQLDTGNQRQYNQNRQQPRRNLQIPAPNATKEQVRDYRKANNLCFYCGNGNHQVWTCPEKQKARNRFGDNPYNTNVPQSSHVPQITWPVQQPQQFQQLHQQSYQNRQYARQLDDTASVATSTIANTEPNAVGLYAPTENNQGNV
jgi:hypothetical protein